MTTGIENREGGGGDAPLRATAMAVPELVARAEEPRRALLPILTHSALSAARACMRLYRNRYVLRLRSLRAEADKTELGDLVHVGLETWWLTPPVGDAQLLAAIRAARKHAAAKKVDPFQLARAEALLIGYHARWADDMPAYRVIGAEEKFRAPLVNPDTEAESKTFGIGGKIDVLVREAATERVLTVEHKTSGEDIAAGSFYWLRLHMDSQVSIYFDGGRALGHDVQGCLYDVIRKPELKPLKATPLESRKYTKPTKADPVPRLYANQREADETPEEFRARIIEKLCEDPEAFYQRAEIARTAEDLVDAGRDRWQFAQQIRDASRLNRWPRNPDACMRYGSACEFLEACAGRADLFDPYLFRAREPHPELAGPASQPSREETAA